MVALGETASQRMTLIENHETEFKLVWKDEFLRNVCAFANADGGVLHIGYSDKGVPVGVENPRKLLETLPNLINQKTGVVSIVKQKTVSDKAVIEILVSPSSVPISYHGRYFSRSGSVVLELQGRELGDFLLRKSGLTWDALETDKAYGFNPDMESVELFKKLAFDRLPAARDEKDTGVLLGKLNLFKPDGTPTRAAFLLFDNMPQRQYPQAVVKIGRFANDADILTSDIVSGNLFQQAENVVAILRTKYLLSPITYEGTHRREKLEYPYNALREAIFNALIHRDYNTTSAIQIRVNQDTLSIANEGKLPPEVSIDDLTRVHLSKPRNPLIADVFYKAGYIESWGRGTLKIIRECLDAGLPKPIFLEERGVIRVIFGSHAPITPPNTPPHPPPPTPPPNSPQQK